VRDTGSGDRATGSGDRDAGSGDRDAAGVFEVGDSIGPIIAPVNQ
jgi:hypothetical protein